MRPIATCAFLAALALPAAAFAQTMPGNCMPPTDSLGTLVNDVRAVGDVPFHVDGLADDKLAVALRAYSRAKAAGIVQNPRLTIIDYSQPSTSRRMFVIDPVTGRVLHRELVAHGRGSGENNATAYGNTPDSFKTSLGVFRTAETYSGKHGYSLRLDGLEPGVNSNARAREIVMHAADYVSDAFIRQTGRLGRSEGCPALDPRVAKSVIDDVKGGSIIVSLGTDNSWIARSRFAAPR